MSFLFNNEANDNAYSILEYIWFDSNGVFRSKTRVLYVNNISSINQIPKWNYDGSSTNQLENNQLNNNMALIIKEMLPINTQPNINEDKMNTLINKVDVLIELMTSLTNKLNR